MSGKQDSALVVSTPKWHRQLAAAIEGDSDSILAVAQRSEQVERAESHRLQPGLFWSGIGAGLGDQLPQQWQHQYRFAASRWARLRAVLAAVGGVLDGASIPWLPIKGMDTAERFFPSPELRPTSDLDVLVPRESVDQALRMLSENGWSFPVSANVRQFQRDLGYNWHGSADHGESLELHYRLWGLLPDRVVELCWERAQPSPDLGTYGYRMSPELAFLVCAMHLWVHLGPPQLVYFWELRLIGRYGVDVETIVNATERFGLQLPVGVAAAYTHQLWDDPVCLDIATHCEQSLRWSERRTTVSVERHGISALTLEKIVASRLLAGRPSRKGLGSLFRYVWPHAGTVEQKTPEGLPWWRRRLIATAKNLDVRRSLLGRE